MSSDDNCSVDSFDSTLLDEDGGSSPFDSNERDEYQEVEKSTQDDTIRLQLWRVVVTIVLLSCTLAVTVTTYYVLEAENDQNFEDAVRFSFGLTGRNGILLGMERTMYLIHSFDLVFSVTLLV